MRLEKEQSLEINCCDINYNILISNKENERKEKLIFITTKKNEGIIK